MTDNDSKDAGAFADLALGEGEFNRIRALVLSLAGISLSEAKRALVFSRLRKRVIALNLRDFRDYCAFVESAAGTGEIQNFINSLTTNKTEFFREAHHFEVLRNRVVPDFLGDARKRSSGMFRVWCAAASTGEEAWTIAMVLADALHAVGGVDFHIEATDIDTDVLKTAEAGVYLESAVEEAGVASPQRFFLRGTGGRAGSLRIRNELRRRVNFHRLNLNDPDWGWAASFDAIFCRNVFIYFSRPAQDAIVHQFASNLNPEGWLFLGHSESIAAGDEPFERMAPTAYRLRAGHTRSLAPAMRPTPSMHSRVASVAGPAQPSTHTRVASVAGPPQPSIHARVASLAMPAQPSTHSRVASVAGPPQPALDDGDVPTVTLVIGDVYATADPCILHTVLGSCVAACLYDPVTRASAMCHFLLPSTEHDDAASSAYGVYALERLINGCMAAGGDKRRMRVKVFGGGYLLAMGDAVRRIGDMNSTFVREFFEREHIPIVAQSLGRPEAIHVWFDTRNGEVKVATSVTKAVQALARREAAARARLAAETRLPRDADVTLFGEE